MLELATVSDFDAIHEIAAQVHNLHVSWRPDIYERAELLFSQEEFSGLIRNRELYVAKLNGTVAGYALLKQSMVDGTGIVRRKVMTVQELGVHESCRGHGIGKAMMEDIHALAKAFRCTDLQVKVYPQNDEAVGFYQRCGFMIQNIGMQKKV